MWGAGTRPNITFSLPHEWAYVNSTYVPPDTETGAVDIRAKSTIIDGLSNQRWANLALRHGGKVVGERILLIEDDDALSRMMRLQLEHAGYQVTVCLDGTSGLEAARESEPDLILLDILLPDIDGWVVCERLQEITDVPIIFASALGSERDVIRGLDLGADDYMIKPFSYKELLARVKSALHRARRAAARRDRRG